MAESLDRVMHQYGWVTGPVECRCSRCSWGASFVAAGNGTPQSITRAFSDHDCSEFYPFAQGSGNC